MTTGIDKESLIKELVDGVFVCTKDGELLYANQSFSSILGFKEDELREKNIGKDLVERILEWRALISLLEQGSLIADYEIRFKRSDGGTVFASISASNLKGADGIPVGIVGVLRDITTRKGVENELRDKAFRTDIINKIAKLAAADPDIRKRVLVSMCSELKKLVNFDLFAVGLTEDSGRHVEVITPDPEKPGMTRSLGRVPFEGSMVEKLKFSRAPLIIDKDLARKSYTELTVTNTKGLSSMLGVPLTSRGRILGSLSIGYARPGEYTWETADTIQMVADQVAGLIDNFTLFSSLEAKIRLQDSLVKSGLAIQKAISTEQIYSAIATNIREVVPYTELSFYMVDWQKSMIYPVYAAGSWAEEVMASPGTIDEGVVGAVAKSGVAEFMDDVDIDPRTMDISGVPKGHEAMLAIPLIGSAGVLGVLELYRPNGQVFTTSDLETGKLFAQQASVAVENANLVSKLQEAKREIEMLNDLMFHDINNFNFASMNYVDIVCESPDLLSAHKAYLEKSLALIRQTATLIENVKKLTKIGVMSTKDLTPIDLGEVLKKIVSGLENSFPGRSISVTLSVPDTCQVIANPLVEELFVNLLSNSVKYDPHQEVEIEIDAEKTVEDGRRHWKVCISDRGFGVPEDKKALLFQKYMRLKPDAKTPGTGLGLSICRALVDKFGGRIWVEDRVQGKSELGSRFCVILPAAKENAD